MHTINIRIYVVRRFVCEFKRKLADFLLSCSRGKLNGASKFAKTFNACIMSRTHRESFTLNWFEGSARTFVEIHFRNVILNKIEKG